MDPIAPDNQIEITLRAVAQRNVYGVRVLLQGLEGRAHADWQVAARAVQDIDQIGTAQHDHRPQVLGQLAQVELLEQMARMIGQFVARQLEPVRQVFVVGAQTVQHAATQGIQSDAVADVGVVGCALDDHRLAALPFELGRQHEPGNSAANNENSHERMRLGFLNPS